MITYPKYPNAITRTGKVHILKSYLRADHWVKEWFGKTSCGIVVVWTIDSTTTEKVSCKRCAKIGGPFPDVHSTN